MVSRTRKTYLLVIRLKTTSSSSFFSHSTQFANGKMRFSTIILAQITTVFMGVASQDSGFTWSCVTNGIDNGHILSTYCDADDLSQTYSTLDLMQCITNDNGALVVRIQLFLDRYYTKLTTHCA